MAQGWGCLASGSVRTSLLVDILEEKILAANDPSARVIGRIRLIRYDDRNDRVPSKGLVPYHNKNQISP